MSSRALFPVFPAFKGILWLLATAHTAESATPVLVTDEKLFRGKQADGIVAYVLSTLYLPGPMKRTPAKTKHISMEGRATRKPLPLETVIA